MDHAAYRGGEFAGVELVFNNGPGYVQDLALGQLDNRFTEVKIKIEAPPPELQLQ